MRDRFTHSSKMGRGKIPKRTRETVLKRDRFTCQFCGTRFPPKELTIDHLVPLAKGGLDEVTNYITACASCNQRKSDQSLAEFAKTINIDVVELQVHGDPVIDNPEIPIEIRLLRKRLFDLYRQGKISLSGKGAQKKLEKAFRREFWQTPKGIELQQKFPLLPGPTRVMIPEIETIAKNERDFWLLVELAKSASTRNLIGTLLTPGIEDLEDRVRSNTEKTRDPALRKRMEQALKRFEKKLSQEGLA